MKIKLAILESDIGYLRRVVPMFNNKYADELEIYSFTEQEAALECIEEKNIDVFLSGVNFTIDFKRIPTRCGFAYLVDSLDISSFDNHKAICKFQKGELIYKQIVSIYSEHVPNIVSNFMNDNGEMKSIAFCSPSGGVGTSTVASACAISMASKGYRVLYINTEIYGDSDSFFACDGQFDFSDVIYAVKSNKTNRAMKLQSTVKQDATGVYFYSSVNVPIDMMEMTKDDYITLLRELKSLGCYDYVVFDFEFPKTQEMFELLEMFNSVVVVSDGTDKSTSKLDKAIKSIQILEGQFNINIIPRMWEIRNKVHASDIQKNGIRTLGVIPLYQSASVRQMARQLSLSEIFFQLM